MADRLNIYSFHCWWIKYLGKTYMEVRMNEGFIKINRKILKWEWYQDTNTKTLFLHCLLKANYQDGRFQGHEVPKGSFVTSLNHLIAETGLSRQNVKTALAHLETTQEITRKVTNKFTLITVNKWELYQCCTDESNTQTNTQLTFNQHSTNTQLTPIEEIKNIKNIKNINNKSNDLPYGEIIDYLNLKTNRKYRISVKAKQCIKARWSEKFTLEDFKQVIDNMTTKWLNDPEMNRYLRPETLFGTKMNGYLNEQLIDKPKERRGNLLYSEF